MSNPEVNSSAVTPQHATITSTTEDDSQINFEPQRNSVESNPQDSEESPSAGGDQETATESENCARSESVIKSPSKPLFVSSSTTPVIKVVDSSQEPEEREDNCEARSIGGGVITQTNSQSASPQNSSSFLFSASSSSPANPFLRTSSFSSNFNSNSFDNADLNSESPFSFAPPKLLGPFSSKNPFDTSNSFERPSIFRAADSNDETETGSTIKTFISLNKEDIGKIKAPSFIKNSFENTTASFSNGSAANKESEVVDNSSDEPKPMFTFGQNLSARVVFDSKSPTTTELKAEINSTSDNLISFSDVTHFDTSLKENSRDSIKSNDSKGEDEGDSACSSQKNGDNSDGVFKRKYEVITGEEEEHNVLSIHGKLYAWDTDKISWIEKGRGHLRLNDVIKNDRLCSRLVMRTSGALRVILNAHVLSGMKLELANDNCLRFTNVDGIFMIKANPKDIDQLSSAIDYRLREITKRVRTDGFDESDGADDVPNSVESF